MTFVLELAFLLVTWQQNVPRPNPVHPDWGPEPPVAPYGREALPSEQVNAEIIFPVLGDKVRWKNDFGQDRGAFLHTGIDMKAPKMTPIVAPLSGILGMKRESFWIYGDNGFSILGTHLNDDNLGTHDRGGDRDVMFSPAVSAFMHVQRGQFIGYVGMSGDASATHLHFEIYAPGTERITKRIRNPIPSLKAAQHIIEPTPVLGTPYHPSPQGFTRIEGVIRATDPESKSITLLLVNKEVPGRMKCVTYPNWLKVTLSDTGAIDLGNWSTLLTRYKTRTLTVVVNNSTRSADLIAY